MAKKLFKPGQSGNPNGRPKGIPNKDKRKVLEWINIYLVSEENQKKLTKEFDSLTGRDYVNAFMKLVEFVVPKQRHQITEYEGEQINFNLNIIDSPKKKAEISENGNSN